MNIDRFPQAVIDAARASSAKWDLFPSVILAQWALESAYGTRMSGKNNPFGIKAAAGQAGTTLATHEQNAAGAAHIEQARFADYAGMDQAFDAHGRFLSTRRYAPVRAARTPDEACRQLRACGYATDINYSLKLITIIDKNDLRAVDKLPAVLSPGRVVVAPAKPVPKGKAAAASAVVVASGAATAAGYQGSHAWVWAFLGLAVAAGVVFAVVHLRRK